MAAKEATARAGKGSWDEPEEDAGASESVRPSGLLERLKGMERKRLLALIVAVFAVLGLTIATLSGAADPVLTKLGVIRLKGEPVYVGPPVFFDLPDIVANLSAPNGEIHVLRASVSLELPVPADTEVIVALMPRVQDAVQAKLRALTPDDLRGSAQIYRLREELLQRIRVAVGPEHVRGLLFRDLLVR